MPGCVAAWCTNSSSKGFKMSYFPRNEERRDAWVKNMNRINWSPTPHSALCEVHFTPDMWEKVRIDGKKKLKACAIPTIFITNDMQVLSDEMDNISRKKDNILNSISILRRKPIHIKEACNELRNKCNTEFCKKKMINNKYTDDNIHKNNISTDKEMDKSINISENSDTNRIIFDSANNEYMIKLIKTEKLLQKSEQMRHIMKVKNKRKIEELENKIKQLEGKLRENDILSESIKHIFNEDQIKVLTNKYNKIPQWCDSTLINSYKLKFACGHTGYSELLRQGFPLPSHRTLRRYFEILRLEGKVEENDAA